MTEEIQLTKAELTKALKEARKEGIKEYAWMKDGIFYVGTTGKTLKKALKELNDLPQEREC